MPDMPSLVRGYGVHEAAWHDVLDGLKSPIVLEVGAFLGATAAWLLATFPGLRHIAVDAWMPNMTRHWQDMISSGMVPAGTEMLDLYHRNLWDHRARAVAMKAKSIAGIGEVAKHVQPAVVYIDAAHDYKNVKVDVNAALSAFPRSIICGDDWPGCDSREQVKRAVQEISDHRGLRIRVHGVNRRFWRYE
jgi:hypothetical protein